MKGAQCHSKILKLRQKLYIAKILEYVGLDKEGLCQIMWFLDPSSFVCQKSIQIRVLVSLSFFEASLLGWFRLHEESKAWGHWCLIEMEYDGW